MLCIQIAKYLGNPLNPMANDKKVAPAKINPIIQEVYVAPRRESLNVSMFKLFCK